MPRKKIEEIEEIEENTELTSLDGDFEEAVKKALDDFQKLDVDDCTLKEYTSALAQVNQCYAEYRKTVESDRDYIQDYVKEANRKAELELERQKQEDEKAEREADRKAEKKANFWTRVITAGVGLVTAGVTLFLGVKGWNTTLKMQENAIEEDHDELLPKSSGHKYVPKRDPSRN